jgi:ATP-dependent DNA helicase RecG
MRAASLSDPISNHFRLVREQIAALKKLQLTTLEDILNHFPARYDHVSERTTAGSLVPGSKVTLYGTFSSLEATKLWKSRRPATEGYFEDGTGRVRVLWFNQPYISKMVPVGQLVKVVGSISGSSEKPIITNPEVTTLVSSSIPSEGMFENTDSGSAQAIFPVYPEVSGITSKWLYHAVQRIFERVPPETIVDTIPADIRARYKLPSRSTALIWVHLPQSLRDTESARKRFAFEEMFVIQVGKQRDRLLNDSQRAFSITSTHEHIGQFVKTLPFPLTGAQGRAIADIAEAFATGVPMARLLEGDVGSGKTAVAAAVSFAVVTSRPPQRTSGTLQVAYMAPTEILATQHFYSFIEFFKHLPINIALITGSQCLKYPAKSTPGKPTSISKAQLLKWVAGGEIAMVIGTHALIQKSVAFQHLALAIVDEQHRFGTKQRKMLARKSPTLPHFLSMTATPIPRTLALTIYGDLDLSLLDELPKGRAEVTTEVINEKGKLKAYERIRSELKNGRQAYIVCPRIDEPDPEKEMAIQATSAVAEAQRLQETVFQEFRIGLMHGKLTPKEKEAVMRDFSDHRIDILVTTSVVEVGVNVPNATLMLIEGAERFGLAQLHQLRGRIVRSHNHAYCFLLTASKSEVSKKRLTTLANTRNGFELAEADLKNRGAGDLLGRKQWGISDLAMEALQNPKLIEAARLEAKNILKTDPDLKNNPVLGARVARIADLLHDE